MSLYSRHECQLPCHPGPCPPCPVMVTRYCPCGREKHQVSLVACNLVGTKKMGISLQVSVLLYLVIFLTTYIQVRCSKTGELPSCSAVCGKTLACGRHVCDEKCHPGPCSSCAVSMELTCHCGQAKKTVFCGETKEMEFLLSANL